MAVTEMDGILIIDKPVEWTSHDVVAKMRGILRTRRIGHTGTLDPFATGVLVVCINRATRLVQFLTGHDKEYLATLRLGWRTDTGDLTGQAQGEPVEARMIDPQMINVALASFRGELEQTPPMFSARKIAGRRLYELARAGKVVERPPIKVHISQLELISCTPANDHPMALDVEIRVTCSAGTYIRTLAEDIGQHLGIGAHLIALRRIRAGRCRIEQAITLDQLTRIVQDGQVLAHLQPMAETLDLPMITLTDAELISIRHGRAHPCADQGEAHLSHQTVSLCDQQGRLQAVASYDSGRAAFAPRVVLAS